MDSKPLPAPAFSHPLEGALKDLRAATEPADDSVYRIRWAIAYLEALAKEAVSK